MTESAETLRAFIAVEPPPEIRARLEVLQRRLKHPLARAGITWAKPAQIHLTVKFLGDVPADATADLLTAIRRSCHGIAPFPLGAEGLGMFPDHRKPRVIWVGLRGGMESLQRLQERIEVETAAWSEPEGRTFHPHLTLGRVRHISAAQTEVLRAKAAEFRAADFGGWEVERVGLIRSTLTADGAVYSQLGECALEVER